MSPGQATDTGILPGDPLARFIYSSSHIRRETKSVKHNAFMPAGDNKTSVFRTKELSEPETWNIGEEVAERRKQTLRTRRHRRGGRVEGESARRSIRTATPPRQHRRLARREKRAEAQSD